MVWFWLWWRELDSWRRSGEEDVWWWKPEEEGVFKVSSTYNLLAELLVPGEELCRSKELVYQNVWKSPTPSKFVAFSRQLLLNCVSTKANLAIRRVLPLGASEVCVFCDQMVEIASHLFLHCQVIFEVWSKILSWLEINFITPHNLYRKSCMVSVV